MKYAPYSFSKMDCWKSCPRKFKLNYIDKIRFDGGSLALERGSYIHHLLEHEILTDPEYKTTNVLTQTEKDKCDIIVKEFCESKLGKQMVGMETVSKERDISLSYKLKPNGYWDKDSLIRGSADKIGKGARDFHTVDWKSGGYNEAFPKSNDQIMFYGMHFLIENPDVDKIYGHYVFIEHQAKTSYTFFRKDLNTYLKKYLRWIKEIEQDTEFNKNPTTLCYYCDYAKMGYCDGFEQAKPPRKGIPQEFTDAIDQLFKN